MLGSLAWDQLFNFSRPFTSLMDQCLKHHIDNDITALSYKKGLNFLAKDRKFAIS